MGTVLTRKDTYPPKRATVFDSHRTAFVWAFHVARCSGHQATVRKINGRWMAWSGKVPDARA